MRVPCMVALLAAVLTWPATALGSEATMDPRWRNLPHTDTVFRPAHYGSLQEWEQRRAHLRRQMLWAAGLWPLPEKTPLKPEVLKRIVHDDYVIENVCFQSRPGLYVCGNLYLPREVKPHGHPGILSPHGHAKQGRLNENEAASYQARCITFARMGCVAFMWDMVDFNDSARQLDGKYQPVRYWEPHNDNWPHGRNERSLWNANLFGQQLWNSIRALDYLESRPEVDPKRLGCTGESGGGTQTFTLYSVDDRLGAAAPVCMPSAYMQGGCNCENAPCLRIDTCNVDFAAMMAPRPVLIVSATGDWTQHTPTVEYPAIRRIYELYGAAQNVSNAHFVSGHGYTLPMREAAYPWFARQFWLPAATPFKEPAYQTEKDEDLLLFRDGLPADALRSHEALVDQLVASTRKMLEGYRPASAAKCREDQRVLGEGLRLSTGASLPAAGEVAYERLGEGSLDGAPYERGVLLGKARGVRVPIWLFRPAGSASGSAALLVHGRGKAALSEKAGLVRELLAQGQSVYAIDAFGIGDAAGEPGAGQAKAANLYAARGRRADGSAETPAQPKLRYPQYFETFNRTDDSERVYDIVQAIGYCLRAGAGAKAGALNVVAFENAGPWVLVAGALLGPDASGAPRLRFAIDADGFETSSPAAYLEKLWIPGILRAGGLRNAAALLAPRDLLLHHTGAAFDTSWAAAAYRAVKGRLTLQAEPATGETLAAFLTGRR